MTPVGVITEPKINQGGPPHAGEFTYVDIGSVDNLTKRIVDPKRLPTDSAPSRARQRLRSGDVLVSMTRPNLNAVALVPPELDGAVGSTGFHVLRARDNVLPQWLYYGVQAQQFVGAMSELVQGALYPAVRPKHIRAFDLPVPELDEQRRIVAELEKQFSRLDEAVANLKRVTVDLKRYHDAVLSAALDGSLIGASLPAGVPIGSTIEMLDQGWSPKCESERASRSDQWAVIKTTAIQPMEFLADENKRLPVDLSARPGLELRAGDLLLTRAGPRSRVGVACTVRSTRPRLMLCDKAYRVRFKTAMAEARYMEIVLNAPAVRDAIDELKTGISDSGVNLTQKRFGELCVPVPSSALQACIVSEVDRRLSIVREVEAQVEANLERARALRQAALALAFGS